MWTRYACLLQILPLTTSRESNRVFCTGSNDFLPAVNRLLGIACAGARPPAWFVLDKLGGRIMRSDVHPPASEITDCFLRLAHDTGEASPATGFSQVVADTFRKCLAELDTGSSSDAAATTANWASVALLVSAIVWILLLLLMTPSPALFCAITNCRIGCGNSFGATPTAEPSSLY
jgi:hypothetical protein